MLTWIALSVAVLALLLAGYSAYLQANNKSKINELEATLNSLNGKVEAHSDATMGLGDAVKDLQSRLDEARVEEIEMPTSEESFLKASGMLERGSDVEQIADECGLPLSEVRLMDAMRRSKTTRLEPEAIETV